MDNFNDQNLENKKQDGLEDRERVTPALIVKLFEIGFSIYAFTVVLDNLKLFPEAITKVSGAFIGFLVCYWIPPIKVLKHIKLRMWIFFSIAIGLLRLLLSSIIDFSLR